MICLRSAADAANIFTQTRKYAAKNMGICTVPESVPGVIFAKPVKLQSIHRSFRREPKRGALRVNCRVKRTRVKVRLALSSQSPVKLQSIHRSFRREPKRGALRVNCSVKRTRVKVRLALSSRHSFLYHPVARHINYAALAELYVVGHLVLGRVVYDEDLVRSCLKYRDIT